VLGDAGLTRCDEASEILHCLHETLREPAFASILVRLVAGNRQYPECEIAARPHPGGSGEKGKGCKCLKHRQPGTARLCGLKSHCSAVRNEMQRNRWPQREVW